MAYGTIAADVITNSDGFTLGGSGATMKNRIINGAMVIDQRATSINDNGYSVDRWNYVATASAKGTLAQSSSVYPTGFTYSLGFTSSSAYSVGSSDLFTINQRIEGYNIADLGWGTANAKTVTISFWVRSSLTGTFGGSINNNAGNRSYPFSYTISVADTWEQKSITIAGDTSGTWLTTNGVGMILWFSMGAGSNYNGTAGAWAAGGYYSVTGATSVVGTNGATFYITGVQLEVGSQATSFDYRQYGTELALCQRYYFKSTMGVENAKLGSIYNTSLNRAFIQYDFHVTMRSTPTVSYTIGNGSANFEYLTSDWAQIYLNITTNATHLSAFAASSEL